MKETKEWSAPNFIDCVIASIRSQVQTDKVILGLSGGVDSSVTAALIHRAIGERLIPIFVDTGCMRYKEAQRVKDFFAAIPNLNIEFVDAAPLFLDRLKGVEDPEQKRKIIGSTFIDVFDSEASKHPDAHWLAQGTVRSDVIESQATAGSGAKVKSHHNVGGLPEKMKLKLLEPLRELFKDQVRDVGHTLGLPSELIDRHPFPGPGLAVRILGEVTPEKVNILQHVDEIFISQLRTQNLYHTTWQAFAILLPIRSTGLTDGSRSYEYVCVLRAVNSTDAMHASWTHLPHSFLEDVSNQILSQVQGVNRVVFDISNKPPATIEWE